MAARDKIKTLIEVEFISFNKDQFNKCWNKFSSSHEGIKILQSDMVMYAYHKSWEDLLTITKNNLKNHPIFK